MVNWDPAGKTALSDEEVIHKDVNGKLYHVRYQIEGSEGEYVTIATTRPETILGDSAVTVHPDDERYKHLVGKNCLVPLINRSIPIIADDYVDREFGTGCLKVTPAHDVNDYDIGQRHNLEVIDVLNPDGTMSEAAQMFIGEDRFVVRKKITTALEEAGNLVEIKDYPHSVGHSERTDAVIEPRLSMQWWMSMGEISKPAFKAVMDDVIQLIPPKFKNTYRHWMENIKDWCISRQLWWGQQIPAWYLDSEKDLPEAQRQIFVATTPEDALKLAQEKTGNTSLTESDLYRDPDVLDTWFSSWLWPFQVFRGLTEPGNEEVKYYYPTNDLVTGPDILFFWVARMIIAGYEYEGERPFNNVYLTGLIRDKKGRKMSKSLGNSPDPLELIALYGADGVRVGILLSSPAGGDLIFDTPIDMAKEDLNSKLCEQGRNFANKMWNAFRLVKGWEPSGSEQSEIESTAIRWMKSRLAAAQLEVEDHFEKFRISDALMTIYKLIWDDFCSWFLEMMKPPKGESISEPAYQQVLEFFESVVEISHPFMPYITEEIWQTLKDREAGSSIMVTQQQSTDEIENEVLENVALIQETVSALRAFRLEKGLSYKDEIEVHVKTDAKEIFESYRAVLEKFLNLSALEYTSEAVADSASIRVRTHEFFIPLAGSVNVEEEISRIKSDIDYTKGFLASVQKKLGNEKFVANAPPAVVEKEKKKMADAETKLKNLQESLASLEGSLN